MKKFQELGHTSVTFPNDNEPAFISMYVQETNGDKRLFAIQVSNEDQKVTIASHGNWLENDYEAWAKKNGLESSYIDIANYLAENMSMKPSKDNIRLADDLEELEVEFYPGITEKEIEGLYDNYRRIREAYENIGL